MQRPDFRVAVGSRGRNLGTGCTTASVIAFRARSSPLLRGGCGASTWTPPAHASTRISAPPQTRAGLTIHFSMASSCDRLLAESGSWFKLLNNRESGCHELKERTEKRVHRSEERCHPAPAFSPPDPHRWPCDRIAVQAHWENSVSGATYRQVIVRNLITF